MQSISSVASPSATYATSKTKTTPAKSEVAVASKATPTDTYTPSGEVPAQDVKKSSFENFDVEAFRAEIRAKLMEQISQAKKSLEDSGIKMDWVSDIPYQVDSGEVAADVPAEFNAENTSQRIVDFALQFRSQASDLTDEEYISQIRDAISQGFKLAKGDLGALPGPAAKLFNDTYQASMDKLDKTLADWQSAGGWANIQKNTANQVSASAQQATADNNVAAAFSVAA
jgi:hypothetical protein